MEKDLKKIKASKPNSMVNIIVYSCLICFSFIAEIYLFLNYHVVPLVSILQKIFFFCMGTFFTVKLILLLSTNRKMTKEIRQIVKDGFYVVARVSRVVYNETVEVNGICGRKICCFYEDPFGQRTEFVSKMIFKELDIEIGSPIKVYLREGKYDFYYVDLDGLEYKKW